MSEAERRASADEIYRRFDLDKDGVLFDRSKKN